MRDSTVTARKAGLVLCAMLLLVADGEQACAAGQSGGVAATITLVEGQAEVVPAGGGAAVPARVNLRVMPGSTVRTKGNGRVELQFDDRTILRLDHNTEVQLLSGPQERGVMVTLGNIWTKVQSIFGASKFRVKTPTIVAGVRGTILRAEVSEEESTIAVDQGEVEVSEVEGGRPVVVRQNQQVRLGRGLRGLKPTAFDPQSRQKWEFFTDPLVQQEIRGILESIATLKQTCAEVGQRTQEIHQALAVDTEAVWRLSMRVREATSIVNGVRAALQPPVRGRLALPPGPRVPQRADLQAQLSRAEQIYAECIPLIGRGRQAVQQHTADVNSLRQAVAAQDTAEKDLTEKLKTFRLRREADPHWHAFHEHYRQSETHRAHVGAMLLACKPLLSPEVPPHLADDPAKLSTIEQRCQWSLKALGNLEKQITDGQAEIARLRGLVTNLPEAPPKPPNRPPGTNFPRLR